ncbi:hypothetical protein GCM10010197_30120 [Nocardioides luteus]|uniref:Lipoyl-binding domain-containing protein n=1 Tax=Nocardioides luteus TaxID=1844 RepID=A0ABQ5SSD4_9ACTN|nr:hypothetical protein GCM10010197_30120 [Nocardioides luteus]GLJ66513.1 hypothetical protein GCM10017579_05490 [Nocardioides luteus]
MAGRTPSGARSTSKRSPWPRPEHDAVPLPGAACLPGHTGDTVELLANGREVENGALIVAAEVAPDGRSVTLTLDVHAGTVLAGDILQIITPPTAEAAARPA